MKVGVVGNTNYPDLNTILRRLAALAPAHGLSLTTEPLLEPVWEEAPPPLDPSELDVLLTFGGDGTLLRGSRLLAGRPVPILGVNLGRVGFLTAANPDELAEVLDALASRTFIAEPRQTLATSIVGSGATRSLEQALNDVVLHKAGLARVIRTNVLIDGENVGPLIADGIVVATPTGSTAYSLSAGGPIVVPGVEAMIMTPICAHMLAVRPIVIPSDRSIVLEPLGPELSDLNVSIDGQVATVLSSGERVEIRRSDTRVILARLPGERYFSRVREKLHWGNLSKPSPGS